ncbi:MAG: tRNA (guanine-N(1)-)-methyltransferase [candidate division TM6 bacterium GW2011_GWF2_37_49]|nr:MAG: tRNA (guanine-N(1)-)-methyltransferase [candidate division TM6 bacterium GW2011_GWF2_37_49]
MIKISIITVFPELYDNFIKTSLIGRAVDDGLVQFNFVKLSDMCQPKERIDEPTVGPGAGMIIKPEVIEKAINLCQEKSGVGFKIFFSPQGEKLNQRVLRKLFNQLVFDKPINSNTDAKDTDPSNFKHIILICSRYEGIDERVEKYYSDLSLSIGDYVLMGGDLPAQVFLECFLRLLPNVVGRSESVENESFQSSFLDHPEYGLPVEWKDQYVPEILRSGNHAEIEKWRKNQACQKTILNRFDWFASNQPTAAEIALALKNIPNHYVVLMHSQVNTKDGNLSGHTSVASIDIHDIARSSATYGIKKYFLVTGLEDQFKIMQQFLEFWHSDVGLNYNASRYKAVERVKPVRSFDEVVKDIEELENAKPLIVTTSAKDHGNGTKIDYNSQGLVWKHNRPVLIVLGTGQGLCEEIMKKSDFILAPVTGMTGYNHLSVRSAAAIILDRWLGLHPITE